MLVLRKHGYGGAGSSARASLFATMIWTERLLLAHQKRGRLLAWPRGQFMARSAVAPKHSRAGRVAVRSNRPRRGLACGALVHSQHRLAGRGVRIRAPDLLEPPDYEVFTAAWLDAIGAVPA